MVRGLALLLVLHPVLNPPCLYLQTSAQPLLLLLLLFERVVPEACLPAQGPSAHTLPLQQQQQLGLSQAAAQGIDPAL
jgi:hypothetical protein